MPLSEHEERILHDMEKRINIESPRVGRQFDLVAPASLHLRRARRGLLIFVAGVAALVFGLVSSRTLELGLVGFVLMLAGGVVFVGALRTITRQRWEILRSSEAVRGAAAAVDDARSKLRRRRDEGA